MTAADIAIPFFGMAGFPPFCVFCFFMDKDGDFRQAAKPKSWLATR